MLAVTDPDGPRGGNISAFVVENATTGFEIGAQERKLGIKGSPDLELHFDNVPDARRPAHRRAGHGLQDRAAHARPHPAHHRRAGRRHRPGRARLAVGYVKERQQFGKPIAEFQGLQFMLADMAMQLEAARQLVYVAAAKCRARRRAT